MSTLQFKDLSQAEFHSAMQALPLVSVDWVVVDADGRVLTGWRENAPARLMGVWDHFYPDSAFCANTPTHYVNLPHCLQLTVADAQPSHAYVQVSLRWVETRSPPDFYSHRCWRGGDNDAIADRKPA